MCVNEDNLVQSWFILKQISTTLPGYINSVPQINSSVNVLMNSKLCTPWVRPCTVNQTLVQFI